jgi:phage shock protein C
MSASRTKFYLDKQNAKWLGVCSGLAEYTGVDVIWLRVGTVLLTFMTFPMGLIAYVLVAWMAPVAPRGLYEGPEDARFWQGVRSNPRRSTTEVRSKFRDIDRRLADVETFVTSSNNRLAREIEQLR